MNECHVVSELILSLSTMSIYDHEGNDISEKFADCEFTVGINGIIYSFTLDRRKDRDE